MRTLFNLALILPAFLFLAFTTETLAQETFCLRKFQGVNNKSRVNLEKAFVVRNGTCPKGFVARNIVVDKFNFSSSTSQYSISNSAHMSVNGNSVEVSTNASNMATVVGSTCDRIEMAASVATPPGGLNASWEIRLGRISASNYGSTSTDVSSAACTISGNSRTCTGTNNNPSLFQDPTDLIVALILANGGPQSTRMSISTRCLD